MNGAYDMDASEPMKSTWRVQQVTAIPGTTRAELVHVEWFKKNPEWDRLMADESYDGDMPDEYVDATPSEDGGFADELTADRLVLDVTHGPVLRPYDNVEMTLWVVTP